MEQTVAPQELHHPSDYSELCKHFVLDLDGHIGVTNIDFSSIGIVEHCSIGNQSKLITRGVITR